MRDYVNDWPVCPGDFTMAQAVTIKSGGWDLPHRPGVYAFLLPEGRRLMRDIGCKTDEIEQLHQFAGFDLAYIGSARDLKVRVGSHIAGSYRTSNFLSTFLAVQLKHAVLPLRKMRYYEDYGEALCQWLISNGWIAYKEDDQPLEIETAWLRSTRTIFNITHGTNPAVARARRWMRHHHPEAAIA